MINNRSVTYLCNNVFDYIKNRVLQMTSDLNSLTVIISPEWSSNNCNSSKDCDNASGFDSLTRYKHESIGDLLTKIRMLISIVSHRLNLLVLHIIFAYMKQSQTETQLRLSLRLNSDSD